MSFHELHNNVTYRVAIGSSSGNTTDNTAIVSSIIDMQGFSACEFILNVGTLADANATFTVLVEDGDAANLSDNAAVIDDELLGTEAGASFIFSDDDTIEKIGYRGSKRYCRLTVTPAANTGSADVTAIAALGPPNGRYAGV